MGCLHCIDSTLVPHRSARNCTSPDFHSVFEAVQTNADLCVLITFISIGIMFIIRELRFYDRLANDYVVFSSIVRLRCLFVSVMSYIYRSQVSCVNISMCVRSSSCRAASTWPTF